MDTSKFEEVFRLQEELMKLKPQVLVEFEKDLINPNIPAAEKVHEVLEYLNNLYTANENLYKIAKHLYTKDK